MQQFQLQTDHPIAFASKDRIVPGGSMCDLSTSKPFAKKCRDLFPTRSFALLDIGCSGGSFVETVLSLGDNNFIEKSQIFAVGLEGCEFSLARQRAAWARIPNNLFCCDVTEKFTLFNTNVFEHTRQIVPFRFDVISAWEVFEHIPENKLNQLLKNIVDHLMPDGIVVGSVSSQSGFHHETLRSREWWLNKFAEYNLHFNQRIYDVLNPDWVRGPNEPNSFNVALKRRNICPGYPEFDA